MSPFDFVAMMWNRSQGMIAMQMDELGGQITFENGKEIADIIAFLPPQLFRTKGRIHNQ